MPPEVVLKAARALFGVAVLPTGQPVQVTPAAMETMPSLVRGTAFAVSRDRFLTCSHVLPTGLTSYRGVHLLGMAHDDEPHALVDVTGEVARDEELDFALLEGKFQRGLMEPLRVDFRPPMTGEEILTVGFPLPEQLSRPGRFDINLTLRATKGIVASRSEDERRFEMDAQFLPGLSGAPVLAVSSGMAIGMAQGFISFATSQGTMSANLGTSLALNALAPHRSEWGLV